MGSSPRKCHHPMEGCKQELHVEQRYTCKSSSICKTVSLPKKPCVSSENLIIFFLLRVWEHGSKHCWRQGFLHLVCHLWDSTLWLLAGWDWRPARNHLWEGYCKGGKSFQSKFTANFSFVLYNLLLILLLLPEVLFTCLAPWNIYMCSWDDA